MAKEAKDILADKIAAICATINKGNYGGEEHDAVTWLGSREAVALERFPSGSPKLDEALGGGWPKGRFIEMFGPESSGKSTMVLHALAEHQKKYPDELCGLIDSEFSFDEEYARKLGVNTKYLIVHQPDSGQQALNIIGDLMKQGVSLLVVDSVAALTTQEEMEGEIGDRQVADQARMMSRSLRTLTGIAGSRKVTVFWTNQLRDKIGVMYGDKTTTPAGRALKHYASIRVKMSRIGNVKEGEAIVSSKNKAEVKKNKTAPPFRTAEFCISFGHGIDRVAEVMDTAIGLKILTKRGSTWSFEGEVIAVGKPATLDALRKNNEWLTRIEAANIKAQEAGVVAEVEAEDDEAPKIKRPKKAAAEDEDAIVPSEAAEVGEA